MELWRVVAAKSCLMVGTQKPMKNFLKILVSSAPIEDQKIQFLKKMLAILLQLFIWSYFTTMQYAVGKNSFKGREWDIICKFIFIFDKVITYWTLSMFHDMPRRQKPLKFDNLFIPRAILKCNMSIASVFLIFLAAYYNSW